MQVDIDGRTLTIDADRVDGDTYGFIQRYLGGDAVTCDAAVDLSDRTAFQQEVIRAIRDVPYGETVTYGALADRIGRPDGVRAVANACGSNPCPLVIPCHRVVAKHGVGGYSDGGEAVKAWLLRHERIDIR